MLFVDKIIWNALINANSYGQNIEKVFVSCHSVFVQLLKSISTGIQNAIPNQNNYTEKKSLIQTFKLQLNELNNITTIISQDLTNINKELVIIQKNNNGLYSKPFNIIF